MENSRKRIFPNGKVIAALLTAAVAVAADQAVEVPFPDAYRSWQHVKSTVAGPEHPSYAAEGGKIYHFYANPQAVEGYQVGKFPNGSVLVRETLRTVAGEGGAKGILNEGERSALDVMMKDDRRFGATSGWGFETFDSKNGRLGETDRARCFSCHSQKKDRDLVFTFLDAGDTGTPYPEGYRQWTFLHSSMVPANFDAFGNKPCQQPCTAGLFHFYANDKAMQGLRTGSYPDGAILAEEMVEWLGNSKGGGGEGHRRIVGVMVKNSQRYGSTDGWGYGNFEDGSRADRLDAKARMACHQCHVARKAQGFVFSEYRER